MIRLVAAVAIRTGISPREWLHPDNADYLEAAIDILEELAQGDARHGT